MTIKPTELAVIVLLAGPEPTSVGFPVFNVAQSTLSDVTEEFISCEVPTLPLAIFFCVILLQVASVPPAGPLTSTSLFPPPVVGNPAPVSPLSPLRFVKAKLNDRALSVPPAVTVTDGVPVVLVTLAVAPVIVAFVPAGPCGPSLPSAPAGPAGPWGPVSPLSPFGPVAPSLPGSP